MEKENVELSLANLKDGAAIEMFDTVLKNDLMPNIQDPNTEHKPEREITLRVKFKPDEDRFLNIVGIECWPSKLAKRKMITTQVAMDVDRDGAIIAKEVIPAQRSFINELETKVEKVMPIRKEK